MKIKILEVKDDKVLLCPGSILDVDERGRVYFESLGLTWNVTLHYFNDIAKWEVIVDG